MNTPEEPQAIELGANEASQLRSKHSFSQFPWSPAIVKMSIN